MDEQRWIDLETKVSYQEVLIEELRQIVDDQYRTIEKLDKNLKLLKDQFEASLEGDVNASHEKPPHY